MGHPLSEAVRELNGAIDDLMTLALGLPGAADRRGSGAALLGLAESTKLRLGRRPDERFARVVESTAYAVVERMSALVSVEVLIRHEARHLRVDVIADERLGTSMR